MSGHRNTSSTSISPRLYSRHFSSAKTFIIQDSSTSSYAQQHLAQPSTLTSATTSAVESANAGHAGHAHKRSNSGVVKESTLMARRPSIVRGLGSTLHSPNTLVPSNLHPSSASETYTPSVHAHAPTYTPGPTTDNDCPHQKARDQSWTSVNSAIGISDYFPTVSSTPLLSRAFSAPGSTTKRGHRKGQSSLSNFIGLGSYKSPTAAKFAARHTSRRTRRLVAIALVACIVLGIHFYRTSTARSAQLAADIGVEHYEWPEQARSAGYVQDINRAARVTASNTKQRQNIWQRIFTSPLANETPRETEAMAENEISHAAGTQHTVHPNGLLLVNPHGRHPIHQLIDSAEHKWNNLLRSQSTTLGAAVEEYKQRYRRNPPRGFEHWWTFAKANNIDIVDEYDQISRDMEPYWALEPVDMRHRNKVMQDREHTFTLSITNGYVTRHGDPKHADIRRAKDMQALLQTFAKWIPGQVNMTFVIDDNPAVMMSYHQKDRMLELARQGEYWGPSDFVPPPEDGLSNFANACPPNSAIRHSETTGEGSVSAAADGTRSFIHDHKQAVDICSHPEFRKLHGHTAGQGLPLTPLVPLFTWAKTQLNNDILVTPLEQYDDDYLVFDPPFEEKSRNQLLWRGSTTGTEFRVGYDWEASQRSRLHFMSVENAGSKEVMWSDHGSLAFANISKRDLNEKYLDTRFSGGPVQCDEETCAIMSQKIDFASTMGLEQQNEYRYLMDVDGNGWSGRFHRLMSTNAVVLKSTVFPEWYADRIVPWVHYVPIKVDYSDLYDVMAFFNGKPDGTGAHTEMAKRIGEAGRDFAKKHWRRVDMASYMFRLVLEYARLLQQDMGEDVDYLAHIRY